MLPRHLNGIADAQQSGSSHTDDIAVHARLRNQVLSGCVTVAEKPFLPYLVAPLGLRQSVIRDPAALTESAQIDRQCVDASRRKSCGHVIPRLACPVDLMEQQHSGTRVSRGKLGCFQEGAVRCLQIDHARGRRFWRRLFLSREAPGHAETHDRVAIIGRVEFSGGRSQ